MSLRLFWIQGDSELACHFRSSLPTLVADCYRMVERPSPLDRTRTTILSVGQLDALATDPPEPIEAPVFHIRNWRAKVFIGPWRLPGAQGCGRCLLNRVASTIHGFRDDPEGRIIAEAGMRASRTNASPASIAIATHLVGEQLRRDAAGQPASVCPGVFVLDTQTCIFSHECLIPESTCPVCAVAPKPTLPDFTAAARPPGAGFRATRLDELKSKLNGNYVGTHLGIIKDVLLDLQSPAATSTVEVRAPVSGQREFAIGRADSYDQSVSIAVLEGLERLSGLRCDRIGGVVTAPYAAVADRAINPEALGLHPEECYDQPGYPLVRFRPDLALDWVWGYSFRSAERILVPAAVAFYGYRTGQRFVLESSNGCALGSSLEEATFHALLELVERDSFLMAWYRRLPLPELCLDELRDTALLALLRKSELVADCRFRAFLSTMEHGIPSLFLLASAKRPGGPCTMASAAASPELGRALRSALHELCGLVLRLRHFYPRRRIEALAMLDDPELVQTIEDHPLLNALPEASSRYSFLQAQQGRPVPFDGVSELWRKPPASIAACLTDLVERLDRAGLETIVIDQTLPEMRHAGMRCVKVVVPGLLPMTFGHRFRRINLPRLRADTIAALYPGEFSVADELGAWPHPFP